MENTLTMSEIKRRGMSAISEHLRAGPTYVMKRNSVAAVILSVEDYQRLLQKEGALIPGMTAMKWLMSHPSSGQRSKAAIDADLDSERDW
jgi:PHD/YefM family antitoxin component YafN of YafNO toxin-antitoxin module